MGHSIFFSWQSDRRSRDCQSFIEKAISKAKNRIGRDLQINPALRALSVDRDTKNVPGSPPIFETILSKIDKASIFIADLTFCGSRIDGRPVPNPNVLLEYGYALKSLSESCVIGVMNSAYGEPSGQNMPFNLSNRRFPIRYHLPPDSTEETHRAAQDQLSKDLERAIRLILDSEEFKKKHESQLPNPQLSIPRQALDGSARFRAPGRALGYSSWGDNETFLEQGPAMWLRVMSEKMPIRAFSLTELQKINDLFLATLIESGAGNLNTVRSDDGIGYFPVLSTPVDEVLRIPVVTFIFDKGDIWSVTVLNQWSKDKLIPFDPSRFASCLSLCAKALSSLDISRPLRWMAGVEGVRGWSLPSVRIPMPFMKKCVADVIISDGLLNEDQEPLEAMRPFFIKLFEMCGRNWS